MRNIRAAAIAKARNWLDSSIANRITLGSAITATALVFLFGFVAFGVIGWQLHHNFEEHARNSLERVADRVGLRLSATRQSLDQFSANSFVVNAYVDSPGREIYLHPILRDFRLPFDLDATLVLFDAGMAPFAGNIDGYAAAARQLEDLARATMAERKARVEMRRLDGRPVLAMAFPIYYPPASDYEGVLVGLMDPEQVFRSHADAAGAGCVEVRVGSESFGDGPCPTGPDVLTLRRSFTAELPMTGSETVSVEYSESLVPFYWQLAAVLAAYLVLGGIGIAAAFLLSRRAGRDFARQLDGLASVSRQLAANPDAEVHMAWTRRDEIGRFVTAFNSMVGALQKLNADLENRVAHRTAELSVALETAKSASRSKSRFLATMSHEIRTPLNGVLGMAQLLLLPDLDEAERRDAARTILTSGQTLLALLNDILDLAKIEAGKVELQRNVLDAEQVLNETMALFAEAASAKNLRLEGRWHGPAGQHYWSDAIRVRQMLANLVSNAIKFTAAGSVTLSAHELERQGTRATLEFAVRDTGIGIAKDQVELLFKPFSQLDSSSTRSFGGTGLGLSIVRSLAERLGGAAGVESVEGQGSRFWFRIAVDVARAGEERREFERRPARAAAVAPPPARLDGLVLVVDDDPINRAVMEGLLTKIGLRVHCVANGQDALSAISRDAPPDIVLMDCQMPVMDGYAATRALRAQEAAQGKARLPIVALTANAFEEDHRQCVEAGMDDVLVKPVDVARLVHMVGRWTTAAAPAPRSAAAHPTDGAPPAASAPDVAALVAEIDGLLAQSMYGALARFGTLVETLGADAPAALAELRALIESMRFDEARARLREIAIDCGWRQLEET